MQVNKKHRKPVQKFFRDLPPVLLDFPYPANTRCRLESGKNEGRSKKQKIYEKLYEMKVVEDVKSKIKVTEKAVSAEEFAKLAKEI